MTDLSQLSGVQVRPQAPTYATDWRVVLALVTAAAWAAHLWIPLPADDAWLITVSERMLDGQRLYLDINELNPPMSAWLYLPWVALARWLGVAPEPIVVSVTILAALASIAVSASILRARGLLGGEAGWWTAGVLALVVAPIQGFAEREHFAVIFVLPMLAVIAARAAGGSPSWRMFVLAGLGAGLAMSIKPHFMLAILLPLVAAAAARRSWRPVFSPECVVAGLVVVGYGAAVWRFHPYYLEAMVPQVAAFYAANRLSIPELMLKPWAMTMTLVVAAILVRDGAPRGPLKVTLATATAGFLAAYLLQGKGWGYHLLPMTALATMMLALSLAERRPERPRPGDVRATIGHGVLVVALTALVLAPVGESAARVYVEKVLLPGIVAPHLPNTDGRRPRLALMDEDLALASPLHRTLGAELVNWGPSLWMAGNAVELCAGEPSPERLDICRAAFAAERAALLKDLERNPPDLIIAARKNYDWLEWARRDPALAAILDDFRVVETYDSPIHKFRLLARSTVPGERRAAP